MNYRGVVLDLSKEIAENCQGFEDAYCVSECPMHTDAIGYVNLIGEGKGKEAILKIREELFLPATLGRICAHPCEAKCRRSTDFNQPISIAKLKRYAADNFDDPKLWNLDKASSNGLNVAIIGAGPAGAQAAIDLLKKGYQVEIFEKLDVVGGMMRVGIPEYRLPRNIIDFEYSYLEMLGAKLHFGIEIGKDKTIEQLQNEFDAVIVASGAHKGGIVPIENNDAKGVVTAAEYLKEIALTQESKIAGKRVVVIGGGDVAMDCARSSFRVGSEFVELVTLETKENLPASHHEIVDAEAEGVKFNCGYNLQEIIVDEDRVSKLVFLKCTSIFDESGNFNPVCSDERIEIECDTLVFATGQIVEDVTSGLIEQGRGGRYIKDEQTLGTNHENIFVAGDCAGTNIVVEAMASGRTAAISVDRFLRNIDLKEDRDFKVENSYQSKLDLPLPEEVEDVARLESKMKDGMNRRSSFEECDYGFSEEEAVNEASRCLKCECKKCLKECFMLTEYSTYPGTMFKDFIETGNFDPLVAYSCNMCDQCTIACPEDFKFAELFGEIRKDMVSANAGKSPMKGHNAISMHQKLGFSKLFCTKMKGGANNE